ncbi:MAG: hypothetical protein KC461_02675 [Dehalococcoidia bacterium]|nr:hypothetical protein [Dehalococcoidia bacterium]MCA9856079.1 hypothetical protein [Dehalococcoidia bacterium]MCB9482651.1 hypothetical protein [Dehalococcoidia bacterium]MCB9491895.1 hypothetical protein [Dehalococcoidia bacterium]
MFVVEPATLIAFESSGYTATVRYASSLSSSVSGVPVSRGIASGQLVAGRRLAVAVFDDGPADAMVVGVW